VTPSAIETVVVDAESDPHPDGWADITELRSLEERLPVERRPEWLRRRLGGLGKRPTRPALWKANALQLLDELGPDWDHRGSGAKLRLVRRRSPWLLDVVLLEPHRAPLAGSVYVVVDSLVDGGDVLHLTRHTSCYVDHLDRPGSAQRVRDHVMGEGLAFLDGWTPEEWGRGTIGEFTSPFDPSQPRASAVEAAAWQLVLDPGTADPIAPQALARMQEQAARPALDRHEAQRRQQALRHAERLVVIAGLDPAERVAAMHACADEKLSALGLDASARKQLRAGAPPP
jgi:hypothetical protein